MNKRTHALAAAFTGLLVLCACAQQENAEPNRAAAPPPPPAIGATGPAAAALPTRDNGPVDTGEVGGMRGKPTDPAGPAGNPPKQ